MESLTADLNTLSLDKDGHLANREDWSIDLAQQLAYTCEVGELNDRHWEVINFIRAEFENTGDTPPIRRLTKQSGVSIKELYQLFPKGPAKKMAKIAGLPKPKGCI